MKSTEERFPVMLFMILYEVVLRLYQSPSRLRSSLLSLAGLLVAIKSKWFYNQNPIEMKATEMNSSSVYGTVYGVVFEVILSSH